MALYRCGGSNRKIESDHLIALGWSDGNHSATASSTLDNLDGLTKLSCSVSLTSLPESQYREGYKITGYLIGGGSREIASGVTNTTLTNLDISGCTSLSFNTKGIPAYSGTYIVSFSNIEIS